MRDIPEKEQYFQFSRQNVGMPTFETKKWQKSRRFVVKRLRFYHIMVKIEGEKRYFGVPNGEMRKMLENIGAILSVFVTIFLSCVGILRWVLRNFERKTLFIPDDFLILIRNICRTQWENPIQSGKISMAFLYMETIFYGFEGHCCHLNQKAV